MIKDKTKKIKALYRCFNYLIIFAALIYLTALTLLTINLIQKI